MQIYSDLKVEVNTKINYKEEVYVVKKCKHKGFYDGKNHYTLTIKLDGEKLQ